MEEVKFSKCEKAITEIDLANIEKRLNVKFPEDFKTHYLKFNGGEPAKTLWVDKENKIKNIEISNFVSLLYNKDFKDNPSFSLPERLIEEWRANEVPVNLIPFAMDWLGNYICFSKIYNQIYYFDREKEPQISILIASSFSVFMESLEENSKNESEYEIVKHRFWGNVQESWAGMASHTLFKIPYFNEDEIEIFLGEEFDEDGEEIEILPTKKQLDNFEKTFCSFLENIDTIITQIKEKTFERYQKLYAGYYEDFNKSGEAPLAIDTKDKHFKYIKEVKYLRILEQNAMQIIIHYELDTEHGIEIKIENNEIIDIGGIAET